MLGLPYVTLSSVPTAPCRHQSTPATQQCVRDGRRASVTPESSETARSGAPLHRAVQSSPAKRAAYRGPPAPPVFGEELPRATSCKGASKKWVEPQRPRSAGCSPGGKGGDFSLLQGPREHPAPHTPTQQCCFHSPLPASSCH